jgi:hypothetical protein
MKERLEISQLSFMYGSYLKLICHYFNTLIIHRRNQTVPTYTGAKADIVFENEVLSKYLNVGL